MTNWTDIENYEGLYMISENGEIKSYDRIVKSKNNSSAIKKGKILKGFIDKYGYKQIALSKNGKTKTYQVHRLVANTFIPNPSNLPCVNHKDEDKTNNCVDNLEWCDVKYNINYGKRNKLVSKKMLNNKFKSKPVIQIDLEGNIINEFPSIHEANRQTKIDMTTICRSCKNRIKIVNKLYKFEYKNE